MSTELVYDINRINHMPYEIKQAVLEGYMPESSAHELIESNDNRLIKKVVELIERKKKYEKNILTTAKFAIRKSEAMKEKLSNLKNLSKEGLILSTIWDIGKRENYAGDSSFYGNAPTQVVEQIILRLTKENDLVLDPMVGSGTTIDVCKMFNRRFIGYDLNPTRSDIIKNDSRFIPLQNDSVDFVFFHPPYLNMVKYSKQKQDLSNESFENFLISIEKVLKESKRVIKNNKYITILVGDLIKNGKFIPISRKIANIAESIGLEDCGQAIKITSNSVSQIRRGKIIYAELAKTNNLKVNHDYVMFWKKD